MERWEGGGGRSRAAIHRFNGEGCGIAEHMMHAYSFRDRRLWRKLARDCAPQVRASRPQRAP